MLAPRVVTRSEWGAKHGVGGLDPGPEPLVILHHTWRPHLEAGCGLAAEAKAVRSIERFHAQTNGWAGIGYNWLVAQSGNVFEGRGWKHAGAHAAGENRRSIGICLMINGDEHPASQAAIESVRWLIAWGIESGELAPDVEMRGHCDFSPKTCPGELVYPFLADFMP